MPWPRIVWRWLGWKEPTTVDPEMLKLARRFRSERAQATADEMSRRELLRADYADLRREADRLKQFRREAERRMMQHGIEIPRDDTD